MPRISQHSKCQQQQQRRRHRKILRDNIQGITKPAIRRLVHAVAPEAQLSEIIYEETRGLLKHQLENITRSAVTFVEHGRRKTVTVEDVEMACELASFNSDRTTGVSTYRSGHTTALNKRESWQSYIYRVLKQVHPETGITKQGMRAVESYVWELFTRLMRGAHLAQGVSGKKTCSSREVQTSVRLVLPGELAKHAVSEGTKSVVKYSSCSPSGRRRSPSAPRSPPCSKSAKAGLQFPVGRVHRYMKTGGTAKVEGLSRLSEGAPVYMTAVLEYMSAELLELAGSAARDDKKVRITPKHIDRAIANDEELTAMNFGTYSTDLVIPELPFQRLVREVAQDFKTDLRFTAGAIEQLQKLAELDLRALFTRAFRIAQHAGRRTIGPADLRAVHSLMAQ